MIAAIHTKPEGCILSVTCLGHRAGTDSETASVVKAIREQGELLKEQKAQGLRRAKDFNLVVADVGLVLETTLEQSLYISLVIESLEIMQLWVDVFGSRDVSAIIRCQRTTLGELKIEFLKQGLEATSCLLPLNLTMIK